MPYLTTITQVNEKQSISRKFSFLVSVSIFQWNRSIDNCLTLSHFEERFRNWKRRDEDEDEDEKKRKEEWRRNVETKMKENIWFKFHLVFIALQTWPAKYWKYFFRQFFFWNFYLFLRDWLTWWWYRWILQ